MKCMHLLLFCGVLCLGGAHVGAQPAPADPAARAQQNFEREIASCNSGALAAPDREACVRLAGQQLDRARGLPPVDANITSTDGRATVMQPEGATPPAGASVTDTSRDGRATVVR
jgi:hypothetical protein